MKRFEDFNWEFDEDDEDYIFNKEDNGFWEVDINKDYNYLKVIDNKLYLYILKIIKFVNDDTEFNFNDKVDNYVYITTDYGWMPEYYGDNKEYGKEYFINQRKKYLGKL